MSWPKKFDRDKEPLRDLLTLIQNKENYTEQKDGSFQMRISIGTPASTKYVQERLYHLFGLLKKEFKQSGLPLPVHPMIQRREGLLVFSWKDTNTKIQWKVVSDKEKKLYKITKSENGFKITSEGFFIAEEETYEQAEALIEELENDAKDSIERGI